MFSKENIRGIVYVVVITLVIALVIIVASPRRGLLLAEKIEPAEVEKRDTLFVFDPNTVTYDELLMLGFDKRTAVGIVKYRTAGKVFGIAEEFALCYGVSDEMFARVRPYIKIGSRYATKPTKRSERLTDSTKLVRKSRFSPRPFEPFKIDTVGVNYLRLIGFSTRQAELLIEYRNRGKGIFSMNELRDCYAVSEEMADSLQHFVILSVRDPHEGLVEINSADSATLRKVRGIGAKTVVAVMQYRKFLGGFYKKEQIAELKCVTAENFAKISEQIYCDSCKISKIDINFAAASEMEYHPYMTRRAIKLITETRESKGGWSCIEEMIEDDIFTKEQAQAIAPYLLFGTTPQDFD
ncbi:MAG: helix-hairpin-helix domain-containing protein [Alistipes sp.]|nr:helix-hairpin-helix domain-containing protein [Alistipes sp.]